MEGKIEALKTALREVLNAEGLKDMGSGTVAFFRLDTPHERRQELYHPHIMILAQGRKKVYVGGKEYIYDSQSYYVQTMSYPVHCEAIIEEGKPLLGILLKVDPQAIREILFDMESPPPMPRQTPGTVYSATLTDSILDACIRLTATCRSENEKRVLGPLIMKEILFYILNGEHGEILREISYNGREFNQISRVIAIIQENYSKPIAVQSLAKEAGMSPTAFHSAFKSMTSVSPLQYIKNIRLHKAKEFLQNEGEKVNIAAMRVGYESSSQFSREYKRCFGIPPTEERR